MFIPEKKNCNFCTKWKGYACSVFPFTEIEKILCTTPLYVLHIIFKNSYNPSTMQDFFPVYKNYDLNFVSMILTVTKTRFSFGYESKPNLTAR